MVEPHATNAVLIGRKEVTSYVLAIMRLFSEGAEEVVVKARGRNVCKAVDTVESLRNLFMKDVVIDGVNIYSEEVETPDGKKKRVSAIEIRLKRPRKE